MTSPPRRAALVAPSRTAVGAFGGALRDVPVEDLGAAVVNTVVQHSGIDPERIDDVVFAQAYANSEVPCVGRWLALHAGLPISVPGMQLDRRCGGGLLEMNRGRPSICAGFLAALGILAARRVAQAQAARAEARAAVRAVLRFAAFAATGGHAHAARGNGPDHCQLEVLHGTLRVVQPTLAPASQAGLTRVKPVQ